MIDINNKIQNLPVYYKF